MNSNNILNYETIKFDWFLRYKVKLVFFFLLLKSIVLHSFYFSFSFFLCLSLSLRLFFSKFLNNAFVRSTPVWLARHINTHSTSAISSESGPLPASPGERGCSF